ncbi:MAG TPA: hypothetical protein VFV96_02925 [Verrucomicrobiae bacterium]|nr:hypothetical protein [Verrucomicrobiae bacterium]
MPNPFRPKPLSRGRIVVALAIAALTDAVQIGLGPLGWAFVDEAGDVIAMLLISVLLGFHPLLLPTFIVEMFPVVDMVPTWTGCVGAVILLRRHRASATVPEPPAAPSKPAGPAGPIIDV